MKVKIIKIITFILLIISLVLSLNTKVYSDELDKIHPEVKSINEVNEDLEIGDYIILDEYVPFSSTEDNKENVEKINQTDNLKNGEKNSPSYILTNSLGLIFIILGVNYISNLN